MVKDITILVTKTHMKCLNKEMVCGHFQGTSGLITGKQRSRDCWMTSLLWWETQEVAFAFTFISEVY